MPSPSDLMLEAGFALTQSIHGKTVTILSGADAGKPFIAVILVAANLTLAGELGEDVREKSVAHFPNSKSPNLERGHRFQDQDGQVWTTIGRTNNPADTTTDFEIEKVTPLDT